MGFRGFRADAHASTAAWHAVSTTGHSSVGHARSLIATGRWPLRSAASASAIA